MNAFSQSFFCGGLMITGSYLPLTLAFTAGVHEMAQSRGAMPASCDKEQVAECVRLRNLTWKARS